MNSILISSRIHDYSVYFVEDSDFLLNLGDIPHSIFIVDSEVLKSHKSGSLRKIEGKDIISLPIGEELKNLESVQRLYDKLMDSSAKRNITIITIGGGIAQDITGYVASTLYRGVNWIFVPTTLLAQADSCIGSKTSLNYKNYKNLMGTFYPPQKIYIYTAFLSTQDDINYFSGLGEVAKLHLMGGKEDTKAIQDALPAVIAKDEKKLLSVVQRSLLIKKSYMEGDEFDTGRRNMLNFGHCFGHAIESATDFAVPHGRAVIIGMMMANLIAVRKKLLSSDMEKYFAERILIPCLKVNFNGVQFDSEKIIDAMKKDKKRTGSGLALVMIQNDYEMIRVNDLSESEAAEAISEFVLKYGRTRL